MSFFFLTSPCPCLNAVEMPSVLLMAAVRNVPIVCLLVIFILFSRSHLAPLFKFKVFMSGSIVKHY